MSIEAVSLNDETEAATCRALGSILRRATFVIEEVETIAAAAGDHSIEAAARSFAGQSLRWLAQQAAMMTTPIWQRNCDAQH